MSLVREELGSDSTGRARVGRDEGADLLGEWERRERVEGPASVSPGFDIMLLHFLRDARGMQSSSLPVPGSQGMHTVRLTREITNKTEGRGWWCQQQLFRQIRLDRNSIHLFQPSLVSLVLSSSHGTLSVRPVVAGQRY